MEQKIEQMLELESELQSLKKEILSELNDITPTTKSLIFFRIY